MALTDEPWDRDRALRTASPRELERYAASAPVVGDSFLRARLMLRDLVGEVTGTPAIITATCPDCGGCHGQPTAQAAFVSVSRCALALVVAVNTDRAVGIDVEPIVPPGDVAAVAARLDAVAALTGVRSIEHWTSVEAVLKADGRGLRLDPRHVVVDGGIATLGVVRYCVRAHPIDPQLLVTTAVALG